MSVLLHFSPFLYARIFEQAPFALLTVTGDGRLLKANRQAIALLDSLAEPSLLKNRRLLQKLADGQTFNRLNISVFQSGRRREFRVEGSPIRSLFRSMFLLSVEDTTAANRYLRKLSYRASRDSLTGLLNRGAFLEQLDFSIARAEKQGGTLTVLYIDINDFKRINSAYGHEAGDAVLSGIARIIARIVGRRGTVGRLGGDELAVFMYPVPSYSAISEIVLQLANTIRAVDIPYKEHLIRVEASYGATLYSEYGETAAAILSRADKAMYRMKGGLSFD
ncbi:GGDEF domain-containing protein [Paenibacillus sp. YN15]|uniref:GGDEF domain-containing protein n=1 Tax=Paenibacillus sp. YN15 TaxID=1742774 RepID=UPI0015EB9ADF|nr:diguanylate cyclase [Paenibacillus sp. YN15]